MMQSMFLRCYAVAYCEHKCAYHYYYHRTTTTNVTMIMIMLVPEDRANVVDRLASVLVRELPENGVDEKLNRAGGTACRGGG